MDRLAMLLALNEEFADAYRRGEKWALDRVQAVAELDNPTRRFPERDQYTDGLKRNWCGSCPFRDGCMECDLPHNPEMKGMVGTIVSYKVECESCGFKGGVTEAQSAEQAETESVAAIIHRNRNPFCRGRLKTTIVSDPLAARETE